MSHHCHATGCTVATKPEIFFCRRHWFMLPKPLRDRIWETYRPGQCDDWQPSREYCLAAIDAVRFVAAKEGIEADIRLYQVFMPEEPVT